MTEQVEYVHDYTREELIELLDLHEETTEDCLAALVSGEGYQEFGIDEDLFEAVTERLDDGLLDSVSSHFHAVHERDWTAEEVKP